MIRFHQTFGAHAGRAFTFEPTKLVITFGRLPDRDVSFEPLADIGASGAHAEVRREPGAYVLVDMRSRNGTFVNGRRTDRAALVSGDEIEFGPGGPRVRVEVLSPPPAGAPRAHEMGLARTAAISEGELLPPTDLVPPTSPGAQTDPPPAMHAHAPSYPMAPTAPRSMPPPQLPPPSVPLTMRPLAPPTGPTALQAPSMPAPYVASNGLAPAKQQSGGGCLRIGALLVGLSLLAGLVGGGVYFFLKARTRGETTTHATLTPTNAPTTLAAAYGGAVYLLTSRAASGERQGLCTAFAVRANVLATTARCVNTADDAERAGHTIELLPAGSGAPLGVREMLRHPDFHGDLGVPGPDVGLVETTSPAPGTVPLATLDQLQALSVTGAWVYGFAGGPVTATIPAPAVTRVALQAPSEFDGAIGAPEKNQLVPHGAMLPPGTAGAPVFDASGAVVAIEAGVIAGHGYAIRADVALALLAGLGE